MRRRQRTDQWHTGRVDGVHHRSAGTSHEHPRRGLLLPDHDACAARAHDGRGFRALPLAGCAFSHPGRRATPLPCTTSSSSTRPALCSVEESSLDLTLISPCLSPLGRTVTFGPTRAEIDETAALGTWWAETWLRSQMALPPSLHRAYYRQRANPRVLAPPVATGGTHGACEAGSRWHLHAFTYGDVGRTIGTTVSLADGATLLSVDGEVRASMPDDPTDGVVPPYTVCSVDEFVGGALRFGSNCEGSLVIPQLGTVAGVSVSQLVPEADVIGLATSSSATLDISHSDVAVLVSLAHVPDAFVLSTTLEDGCASASLRFIRWRGDVYGHDPRLQTVENTLEAPASSSPGVGAACPAVAKTFVNEATCVPARSCASAQYASASILLDTTTVPMFYGVGGRHVNAIDGLRLEGAQAVSPCESGVSRWRFVGAPDATSGVRPSPSNSLHPTTGAIPMLCLSHPFGVARSCRMSLVCDPTLTCPLATAHFAPGAVWA